MVFTSLNDNMRIWIALVVLIIGLATLNLDTVLSNICAVDILHYLQDEDLLVHSACQTSLDNQTFPNAFIYTHPSLIATASSTVSLSHIGRFHVGMYYYNQDNVGKALDYWEFVPNIDVFLAISSAENSETRPDYALNLANLVVNIDQTPDIRKRQLYINTCSLLRKQARNEEAIDWCQMTVEVIPNGWTQIRLSSLYLAMDDPENAERFLKDAIHDGNDKAKGVAYLELGELLLQQSNKPESLQAFTTAYELGRRDIALLKNLVGLESDIGEIQRSCEYLKELRDTDTDYSISQDVLDECKNY